MGNHRFMRVTVLDDASYDVMDMETKTIGVRPAIWVNTKAISDQIGLSNEK